MKMSKKDNLKRWVDDHRRGKAPLYVTEVPYAIIDALPDTEPGVVPVDAPAYDPKDIIWHNPDTGEVKEWVSTEDVRKLRIMKAMEKMASECNDKYFRFGNGTWFAWSPLGLQKVNEMYSTGERASGTDQPKQIPPPIGPVEARDYIHESLKQANLCLAQNAHMISLLSEIRDALVRTQLPGLDSKPESDSPDLWEGWVWKNKTTGRVSYLTPGGHSGWRLMKVREVRE